MQNSALRSVRIAKYAVLTAFLALLGASPSIPQSTPCVQIYFDAVPGNGKPYTFGRTHALMLQNLLGHFPKYQQIVAPIETYRAGDLDRCQASFYLGTYFENKIPPAFYDDFANTGKTVVWMGYSFWRLGGDTLDRIWGVHYDGLSQLDRAHMDSKKRPGFYRYFDYKGETFEKYGEWSKLVQDRFDASYETPLLSLTRESAKDGVHVWARHDTFPEKNPPTPYVLSAGNHWLIGDSPFSYTDEADRYVIVADLLFDILGEKPTHQGPKRAVFRVEDIHPRVPLWQLYDMVKMLDRNHVPFSISIIPIYVDPFGVRSERLDERFTMITQATAFVEFVKFARAHGGSYIYHGETHQGGHRKNPFTGVSGDDFEFWDRVANAPMPEDSAAFVIGRLEEGLTLLNRAGVQPFAWLTPHYQASPLDYSIFANLYRWNVGRVIYFPHESNHFNLLPESLAMDVSGSESNGKRLPYFKNLRVDYDRDGTMPAGQFYPYEIYGDVYGQRLIPENVGNLQPFLNEQVLKAETADDLIRTLKRNRVLNSDFWGSFFIHPYFVDTSREGGIGAYPGDSKEMERIIRAAREFGYEFVDLEKWSRENIRPIRPEPIEIKIQGESP